MKKMIGKSLIAGLVMLFLMGCAAQGPKKLMPDFSPQTFDADLYNAKVDRFLVVLDASSSMGEYCSGYEKFEVAKAIVTRMNQTLPEMELEAGLRTFGHSSQICKKPTKLMLAMEPYSTSGFAKGIDMVTVPGGTSPLPLALGAAAGDLDGKTGKTALIIVSDAKDIATADAEANAQALKDKFGSSLCVYTVLVGKDARGEALLKKIADIGECGFFTKGEDLMTSSGMANFVEQIFLEKKPVKSPIDSDGDGVYDDKDKCPDTPRGVVVDSDGCPLDTDGDGVYDYLDKCPGTPVGARVNTQGCWILTDLLFDFDKAIIKPAGYGELGDVIKILEKNPGMNVVLQGHTDSIGAKAYNKKLSMRRAKAVKSYFVKNGISAARLSCEGFGEARPVASNSTKEGRALNRRVGLMPVFK